MNVENVYRYHESSKHDSHSSHKSTCGTDTELSNEAYFHHVLWGMIKNYGECLNKTK